MKLLGTIKMVLDVTPRQFTKYFVIVKYWGGGREYKGSVYQLFIDFKKAYDSVKREVLYNILTEFGIPKKLVKSDALPIYCGLKQGVTLSLLLFNFALDYAIRRIE